MATGKTKTKTNEAGEAIESLGEAAGERLAQVRERLGEYAEETMDTARQLESRLEDTIRDRPMTSVLVTAGFSAALGALLGYVLTRR